MDVRIKPKRGVQPHHVYAGSAALVLVFAAVSLAGLRDSPPQVSRSAVFIDQVRRGELRREVSGSGRLAAEGLRLVSARSAGTVERILLKPGAKVSAGSVLLELVNPELELAALEAASEVEHAEAELLELRASTQIQLIEQRASVENVGMQKRDAARKAQVQERLAGEDVAAPLALAEAQERARELDTRLDFEREHLLVLQSASRARIAAKQGEVARLRSLAELRQRQVDDLKVRAGIDGVLQELPLDVGQQVALGARLAKVADPTHLKAELKIPEARAKELAVGQQASIEIQSERVRGHVSHIDPAVHDGSVVVDVVIDQDLPPSARPDLSVDGRIELERLPDVLYTGKTSDTGTDGVVGLFKVLADGKNAERVNVRFGKTSVSAVEVVAGLREGDRVILSDMSEWNRVDRIKLE